MKRLITGALAALTLVGGTASLGATAQAQPHQAPQARFQTWQDHQGGRDYDRGNAYGGGYGQNRGDFRQVRFDRGQFLPQSYRGRDQFVDYRRHHLRAPPRGYGWVQGNSNQFLMVALATGLIAAIANN